MSVDVTDEERRTLWVGGIDSRVDEELLYELMLNAGPIINVTIPKDKQTNRPKPFAFVLYEYEESLPYAVELFKDTKLFGASLRLQNRATGLGISLYGSHWNGSSNINNNTSNEETFDQNIYSQRHPVQRSPIRQNTSPRNQMSLNRNMNSQIYEDLPQPPYNGGIHSPNQLMSLYMNLMSAQNPLLSSQGSSPNSFISPHQASSPNTIFSPHVRSSPQIDHNSLNFGLQDTRGRRAEQNFERGHRSTQGYQRNSSYNRNEDRYDSGVRNSHRRDDRSRSNDRHGSRDQRRNRR